MRLREYVLAGEKAEVRETAMQSVQKELDALWRKAKAGYQPSPEELSIARYQRCLEEEPGNFYNIAVGLQAVRDVVARPGRKEVEEVAGAEDIEEMEETEIPPETLCYLERLKGQLAALFVEGRIPQEPARGIGQQCCGEEPLEEYFVSKVKEPAPLREQGLSRAVSGKLPPQVPSSYKIHQVDGTVILEDKAQRWYLVELFPLPARQELREQLQRERKTLGDVAAERKVGLSVLEKYLKNS